MMMCIGLIPLFLYSVLRSFIDALGKTRVSMFITLLSAPINIVLNYVFIYGKFGLPALGGVGAGLSFSNYLLAYLNYCNCYRLSQ